MPKMPTDHPLAVVNIDARELVRLAGLSEVVDVVNGALDLERQRGGAFIFDGFSTEEALQVVSRHALNARGDLFHLGEATPQTRAELVSVAAMALCALRSWDRRNGKAGPIVEAPVRPDHDELFKAAFSIVKTVEIGGVVTLEHIARLRTAIDGVCGR